MSHREDLLAGAVKCLREKGYAGTTARDIVAASGTNLASIGYHYGSTQALMNAAVLQAMDDFGAEIGRLMADASPDGSDSSDGSVLGRFERFWTHVIESFRTHPEMWKATFDIFTVAQRNPEVREAIADGLEGGRLLWARELFGDEDRAVGSLYQALLSGILVQWLTDPARAPSAADLAHALQAVTSRISIQNAKY